MSGTALVRQNVQIQTLAPASAMDVLKQHPSPALQYLVEREALIAPLLPERVRFLSVVWELVAALAKDQAQKTPMLVNCTPDSVFLAITRIQEWGLKIGHTAHLVPFSRVCTPIIDYKGEIQLATDARVITHAKALCVYEGEEFEYEEGLNPVCRHVPSRHAKERGVLVGAYAILTLPTREKIPHYMPLGDIDVIRKRFSKQWKDGDCPPWYAQKTTLRQGLKTVPKSTNAERLVQNLEAMEEGRVARADELASVMADAPEFERTTSGEVFSTNTGEIRESEPAPGSPHMTGASTTEPERGTLEWALLFPLPWRNSDQHGKPLGGFSAEHLQSIADWCERKSKEAEDQGREFSASNVDLYDATQLVLAHLAKAQTTLPLGEDADIPTLSAPTSTSVTMPPPGRIEDAYKHGLALDDRQSPAQPKRNALAEP